jgi:hypothetical protein
MGKPVYLVELTALAWPQFLRSGTANSNGSGYHGRTLFPVTTGQINKCSARLRSSASPAANGTTYYGIEFYDTNRAFLGTLLASTTPGTTWATVSANQDPSALTGAAWMAPVVSLNVGATTGWTDVREIWIENAAAPGVVLSRDKTLRDVYEWERFAGTDGSRLTLLGSDAEALTLRYATGAYMTQPGDTPAKAQYDARVRQPGQLRMALPDGFFGGITSSYGQIVLENSDGELDGLAYHGMDGQAFTVLAGQDDAPYSSFSVVMRGTMQQPMVDRKGVTIRLAGRDAAFDQPVLTGRYLGNNSLPNGLEGPASMAGQAKPRLYGAVYGISPPCVNSARYIYQVDEGIYTSDVLQAWDAGVELTRGTPYTSQSDMETNAPAAGTFRVWQSGGCFRLGSAPTGVVTCDAESTNVGTSFTYYWWKLLYRLAIDAGVQTSEIQFGQNDALTQPDNWPGADYENELPRVGVWVNDSRTTYREVMDELASAVGAWYGFVNWGGVTTTAALKLASEVFPPTLGSVGSVGQLDDSSITSLTAAVDPGPGRGVPVWQVELSYRRNYTVYTPSMAPSLPPEVVTGDVLGLPKAWARQEDTAAKSKNTNARKVVRDTCMVDVAASVVYEARRQLELLRYTKQWFEVRVRLAAVRNLASRPRLGGYLRVDSSRLAVLHQDGVTRPWGYFNVMSIEINWARGELTMMLRQATEPSL